jgi:hypothetical protein
MLDACRISGVSRGCVKPSSTKCSPLGAENLARLRDGERTADLLLESVIEVPVNPTIAAGEHLIEEMRLARRIHELTGGIGRFLQLLKAAADPDGPAISGAEILTLQVLSDRAIEIIEARIDTGQDKDRVQRELAAAVYEIRQNLELVDRWRRPIG